MMKLAFSAASLWLCAASVSMAGDGRPTAWAYMDTGIKTYSSLVGMTADRMWPILFNNQDDSVYVLNPGATTSTFNVYQTGTWQTKPEWASLGYVVSVLSGPQGQMVVYHDNDPVGYHPTYSLIDSTGQITPISFNGITPQSVAFAPNGDLYLLNGTQATGFPTSAISYNLIAVSPTGLVARANSQQYQTLDNQGNVTTISLPSGVSYLSKMVFDSNDQAHFFVSDSSGYAELIHDSVAGAWSRTPSVFWESFRVESSPSGVIGKLKWETGGNTTYQRYDSDGGWEDFVLGPVAKYVTGLSLQYDRNDSPVISYLGTNGNFWIAYDPNSIPEPTSVATFAFLLFGTYNVLARQMRDPA